MFVRSLITFSGRFASRACRSPHVCRIFLRNATEQCISFKCGREYISESRCLVPPSPNTTLWKLDDFPHHVIGLKVPTHLCYFLVSAFCRYANFPLPQHKNAGVEAWKCELSIWTTTTTPSTREAMFPLRFHYIAKTFA